MHLSPYDTYDKSACNCLRDFASPSLLDVPKLTTTEKEKDCEFTEDYTHDSCSSENLFDYAIDGSGLTSTNSAADKDKMHFPTPTSSAQYMQNRHRRDLIVEEIELYETSLGAFGTATLATKTNLLDFTIQDCNYAGYKSLNPIPIVTPLMMTKTLTELECPTAWAVSLAAVKISDVIAEMKKWTAHMHTYNKLRTSLLDSSTERSSKQRHDISKQNPPKIGQKKSPAFSNPWQTKCSGGARSGGFGANCCLHPRAGHPCTLIYTVLRRICWRICWRNTTVACVNTASTTPTRTQCCLFALAFLRSV
jgi:hypothetical protein